MADFIPPEARKSEKTWQPPETKEKKSDVSQPAVDTEKRKSFSFSDIGSEAGIGGVLGTFAPEILSYGVAPAVAMIPGGAALSPFIAGAGQTLRGARLASAVTGAIGGAGGELAGQTVEKKYGPGVGAETARLLGSVVSPMPLAALGTYGGKAASSVLRPWFPGLGKVVTLGQMMQEKGIETGAIQNLSAEKKAWIEGKLKEIRGGGERSVQAQKDVFSMLENEAGKVVSIADTRAQLIDNLGKEIIQEAEANKGVITASTEKKIANLRTQFDSAADKLRLEGQAKSSEAITKGAKAAEIIRRNSANQSQNVRNVAEIEAKQQIDLAQKEADQLIKTSQTQIANLERIYKNRQTQINKYLGKVSERSTAAKQSLGERILPTKMGEEIRPIYQKRLDDLKAAREKSYKPIKDAWLEKVRGKEATGTYRDTKAYESEITAITNELVDESGKLRVTDPKSIEQVKSVLGQINPVKEIELKDAAGKVTGTTKEPVPVKVEALEVLLRRLKDRSGGLPAEGVDAIDQIRAGRLAKSVEKIIDDFSEGTYAAAKNAYSQLSKPINEFNTSVGKYVTEKPEGFDAGDFLSKLSNVGGRVFDNKNTAQQIVGIAGPEKANDLARGYLVDQLGAEPTAAKIKSVLDANRDWLALPEFRQLAQKFESAANQMSGAATGAARLEKLSNLLGTKIGGLPSIPVSKATKRVTQGESQARAITGKAEKEAQDIATKAQENIKKYTPSTSMFRTGAESDIAESAITVDERIKQMMQQAQTEKTAVQTKAEEAVSPFAERSQQLREDASNMKKLLLGESTDVKRIESFLTSGSREEWQEISRVLKDTPGGKERIADAVGQILARKFESSPKSAIDSLEQMGNNLTSYGLLDQKAVSELMRKMNEIYNSPVGSVSKSTFVQRLVRNAIVGGIQTATGVPGHVFGKMEGKR